MTFDFDQGLNRRATESLKWLDYPEDVLPMWVADMDFRSPEPVIEALKQRVEHGVFGYPKTPPELRSLIVERLERLYHWQIQPDDIAFVPGVVTGFHAACYGVTTPQDGILIQTPVYPPIVQAAKTTGRIHQEAPLHRCPDGTYDVDSAEFEAAFDERTRMFLLCNPHNPVGRVFTQHELETMAETCLRHDVTICSDEIHGDLIFSGHQHIPIASLDPEIAQHTITLMAPSKTFNIAGLECSFAVITNPELKQQFQKGRMGLAGWVNLLGMVAAQAAYSQGQAWLDALMVYLEANRDYLYEFVQKELPGIHMSLPEGTYLAWLDCREAGTEGNPSKFFLEKAHVALNDGLPFGTGGEGFVRLNFGCPRSMLTEALERMKRALQENGAVR